MRRYFALTCIVLALMTAGWPSAAGQVVTLAGRSDSVKLAVIGDSGTGNRPQYELADRMVAARVSFPFDLVLMVGDNMLGRQEPQDFFVKFERPYRPLLGAGVRFLAALGNHDDPVHRSYPHFNMNGERYYTYARSNVRFLVFDTNNLDPKQLAWIEATLKDSKEEWKICSFHHPLYSNGGRHGSNIELRLLLEPLLVKYGVSVVFSGHDHIYERIKPQKGITYFVAGSSGQLRKGDLRPSNLTAAGFDQDLAFVLVEIAGDDMLFQVISRTGSTVDSGVIRRRRET